MILVILGTQDKPFDRLLKAIDKEINKGNIKDKVIVQAGNTKYKSKNMEIFDLISNDKLQELIKEADLIITHGGVGSIIESLKNNKKIIAAARLKKYGEHVNDHQLQIIESFRDLGYLLELKDFNKISKLIEKSKTFKPKKFNSNTNNMIKIIEDYIDNL
jgi:UDP-N-acetylglucosamine transferase subunit ALG13